MSRLGVAAMCAATLLAGFVAGRMTGSGPRQTVTVHDTVERAVVIHSRYVGSARDGRDRGPLDLARVESVRRGDELVTTIVAGEPWHDSLIRHGGPDRLSILYDTNGDGAVDRQDAVFQLKGELMSWVSSFRQGIWGADVTRRSTTTITVGRDAHLFFNASGQAPLLATAPIGVAVVARWPGGGDRVPNRGWIVVPPPAAG